MVKARQLFASGAVLIAIAGVLVLRPAGMSEAMQTTESGVPLSSKPDAALDSRSR